jgi:hypothetical protein
MTGKLKQNLKPNSRVRIARTTDHNLDGQHGTIVGISFTDAKCDFYIVLLDEPFGAGWSAIQLIESCLDDIGTG